MRQRRRVSSSSSASMPALMWGVWAPGEGSSTSRALGGLRLVPGHYERRGRRGGMVVRMMMVGMMVGRMLTPPHGRRRLR
eukprot:scaffold39844_cov33-Phaeocystis_antarctica.AAC.1